jgi:ABC-type sugar transport system ATPase subunit
VAIELAGAARVYPGGHVGVRNVDLTVADGELLVLVGPSGCGKSTLLRLIAGLEPLTGGRIAIDGTDVTAQSPQERDVAMVFQSYALYPHMSVRDNLAYGLRVRRTDRRTIEARVAAIAAALDLEALLDRRPAQLSGGQRQRVALGRALVRQPRAFLLDEPLSNLDPALRLQARSELLRLHRQVRATTVYVTHDQEEAMTLGGRVAVMRDGAILQVAPPLDLYARPADTFVARFVGSPPMNIVDRRLGGIEPPGGTLAGIRPHDVALDGNGEPDATIDLIEPRGYDTIVHLRTDDGLAVVAVTADQPPAGGRVRVRIDPKSVHWFDAATGKRRPDRSTD